MLANMKPKGYSSAAMPRPEEVDTIPATEMKNAHGKRLPEILKKKGVARVTRYGKSDYYVVSVQKFDEMAKLAIRPENPKLKALREAYRDLVDNKMQAAQHKDAFAALSQASDDELGSATVVGSAELATH
jgi:enamine deaminase RidA (YjgF/YER057c/UK114 family)